MLCELFIFDCGGMCKFAGYFTNFFEFYIFGTLKHWYVLWFASNNAVRVILTLRAFRACALKGLNARKLAFNRQACLNQIII